MRRVFSIEVVRDRLAVKAFKSLFEFLVESR